MARVFQAIAAFVHIQVVGLAVGQDQQQALALGSAPRRSVASRIAANHAGVVAGLDGANPVAHEGAPVRRTL